MSSAEGQPGPDRFAGLEDVRLEVAIRVGRARCSLARLTEMQRGDVIALDRRIGEPFDMLIGGQLLARVEPVAHPDGVAVKLVAIPEDDDAG